MFSSKNINFGQTLQFNGVHKGTYEINYSINSQDQDDRLSLNVTKGSMSWWKSSSQTWEKINGKLELQNNGAQSEGLKLRVDRSASFNFFTVDGYNHFHDDAPTNPEAQITLVGGGLKFDMGLSRTTGWNMGKIYPTTNLNWNDGIVSSSGNGIRISESIGGDDVSDYSKFQLTKDTTITLTTRDAIAQIINSKGMVVGDSHDSYNSTITVTLKKGTYYLGYSTESSTESIFTSELKFGTKA
ncbi:MAG: hypothetical protein ACIWVG_04565 [Gloeotrichia echinulata HAB0833]|jgi:hypothetical protein|nr:hypothetical protein [Gloeotrichia echinulata DEX184]